MNKNETQLLIKHTKTKIIVNEPVSKVKDKYIQMIQSQPMLDPPAAQEAPTDAISNGMPDETPGATDIAVQATHSNIPVLKQGEIINDIQTASSAMTTQCNAMKEATLSLYHECNDQSLDAVKNNTKEIESLGILSNEQLSRNKALPYIPIWVEYPSITSKHTPESSKNLNSCPINSDSPKATLDSLRRYKDLDMPNKEDPFIKKRLSDLNKSTHSVDHCKEILDVNSLKTTKSLDMPIIEDIPFTHQCMSDRQGVALSDKIQPQQHAPIKLVPDANALELSKTQFTASTNKDLHSTNMPIIEDIPFTHKCMSDRQSEDFLDKTQPQQHAPLKLVPDAKTLELSETQLTALTNKDLNPTKLNIVQRRNADGIRKCSKYMLPSSASGRNNIISLPERKSDLQSLDPDLFVDPVRCIPRISSLPDELKIVAPREQGDDNCPDARVTAKKTNKVPKFKEIPIIPKLELLPNNRRMTKNLKSVILKHRHHSYNNFVPGTKEHSAVPLKDRLREDWLQKFVPENPRRRRRKTVPILLNTVNTPQPPLVSTKHLAHSSLTKSDGRVTLRARAKRTVLKNKTNIIHKNMAMIRRKRKSAKINRPKTGTQNLILTSPCENRPAKIDEGAKKYHDSKGEKKIVNPDEVSTIPKNETANPSSGTNDLDISSVKPDQLPVAVDFIAHDNLIQNKGNIMKKENVNSDTISKKHINATDNFPSLFTKDCVTSPATTDECPMTMKYHIEHHKVIKNKRDDIVEKKIANLGLVSERLKSTTESLPFLLTKDCDNNMTKTVECPTSLVGHNDRYNFIKNNKVVIEKNLVNPDIVNKRIKNITEKSPYLDTNNDDRRSARTDGCDDDDNKFNVTLKCHIKLDKLTKSIVDMIKKKIANVDVISRRLKNITDNVPSLVTKEYDTATDDAHPKTLKCCVEHHKSVNHEGNDIIENEIAGQDIVSNNHKNATENILSSIENVYTSSAETDECHLPLNFQIENTSTKSKTEDSITEKNIANPGMANRRSTVIKYCHKNPTNTVEFPETPKHAIKFEELTEDIKDVIEEKIPTPSVISRIPRNITENLLSSDIKYWDKISSNTSECPIKLDYPVEHIMDNENATPDTDSGNIKFIAASSASESNNIISLSENSEPKLKPRDSTQLSIRPTSSPITIRKLPNTSSAKSDEPPLAIQCHIACDKLVKNMRDVIEKEIVNRDMVSGRPRNTVGNLPFLFVTNTKNCDTNPVKTDESPVKVECHARHDDLTQNKGNIIDSEIANPGLVSGTPMIGTEDLPSLVTKDFIICMPNRENVSPLLISRSRPVQQIIVRIPITEHMRIPKPNPKVRILEQIIIKPEDSNSSNEEISMTSITSSSIHSSMTENVSEILYRKSILKIKSARMMPALDFSKVIKHLQESNCKVLIKPLSAKWTRVLDFSEKSHDGTSTEDQENTSLRHFDYSKDTIVDISEANFVSNAEQLIVEPVDARNSPEISTNDFINEATQTDSSITEPEVFAADSVEISMQNDISYHRTNVVNSQMDWSVTPWVQPRFAVVMSQSADNEFKESVEFINFSNDIESVETKKWQKEIQQIIQNLTLDAQDFSNYLNDIPLPDAAPQVCEIPLDEIPLPEESHAANVINVPLLRSVKDAPRIDQVTSQQHLPSIFDYKPEAPVITASSLPSGAPILRVDDTLLPLALCDEYLVLTDADIPCNRPNYFTLAPYDHVSRVIIDDYEVRENDNSGSEIKDENHDNDVALSCNNCVRVDNIDDNDEHLYSDDIITTESAKIMKEYHHNSDIHVDSDNIVVNTNNDINSIANNNNTQEYDNNIGIRDCGEEDEENKTDDKFLNKGVATDDELVYEGVTTEREVTAGNEVLSVVCSPASFRELAASGALLLLFAATSGVTSLLQRLWLRGRLVLCGNVDEAALKDLASQLNASSSPQRAPNSER